VDPAYFQRLARYNAWANRRLYAACAALSGDDYRAPRPSFFGSIQRTLNHILAADRIWLGRFEDVPHGITALDQLLYDGFDELSAARTAEDERILSFTARLDASALERDLVYRNMAGQESRAPLRWAIAHFFNHQTHHRGQAHCLLSGTAVAPPPLDLLYFLAEDR
jgi:uncharacterized damage-inducible protein DinB